MLRDLDANVPVHTVTDDLTDIRDKRDNSAQDFWVYYGLRTATSIAYLRAVFEKGGTPEHVDAAIALADSYWTWVKNQAFEKVYTLDGTLTNGPCTFESAAFGTLFNLPLRFATTDHAQGTLGPLSSMMVEVTIDASVEVGFIHAENDADSDADRDADRDAAAERHGGAAGGAGVAPAAMAAHGGRTAVLSGRGRRG